MQKFIKQAPFKNLEAEYYGLKLLDKYLDNNLIKTPKVFELKEEALILERVESIEPTNDDFKHLAKGLAKLHLIEFDYFGLEYNNFIGLNPQKNVISDNWAEFFYEYRLLFQVGLIKNSSIKEEILYSLKSLKGLIYELIKDVKPSLLHGDLWFGNVLFGDKPYLIDPAVYFGDFETDIAFSEVFGGFNKEFYEEYNRLNPLSRDYEIKKDIYNIYHYLNHYNLFGGYYLKSVYSLLKKLDNLKKR